MNFLVNPILNVGGRCPMESFLIKQTEALIQVFGGEVEMPDIKLRDWTCRQEGKAQAGYTVCIYREVSYPAYITLTDTPQAGKNSRT